MYINSFKKTIFTLTALFFTVPFPLVAYDVHKESVAKSNPAYTRLFYYTSGQNAKDSLYLNHDTIDILAPQVYTVNEKAEMEGGLDSEILSFAKSKGIEIMPLLTNKNFGQKSLSALLGNKTHEDKLIKAMIKEAKKHDFIGWQIDFEQMNVGYKDKFSAFIKKMGERMDKENLLLSVAVIAKISDTPSDYKKTLWNDLIGVYDYKALAEASDFISIMSYDAPDSKGAISPYLWLREVLDYSVKFIPKEKISLGLGLYYWKWEDKTGKLTGIGGFEGLKIALGQYSPKMGYDDVLKAPYLKYIKNKKAHTIWYENEVSVKSKIGLIKEYGLTGFSAWALGLEMPVIHSVIKE